MELDSFPVLIDFSDDQDFLKINECDFLILCNEKCQCLEDLQN